MTTNLVPISSEQFICKFCDYTTSRKSQYERHLSTSKHINTTNTTNLVQQSSNSFICECGKEYKHHSSLWNHKKKCLLKEEKIEEKIEENIIECENNITPELILSIIHQNQEFKDLLLEQNKTIIE